MAERLTNQVRDIAKVVTASPTAISNES